MIPKIYTSILSIDTIPNIAPIEKMHINNELSGFSGTNRSSNKHSQMSADNDVDAIKAWLSRFTDKKTTFESYRKEAERLLLWSVVERRKPLSSLLHEDLIAYQGFISNPTPVDRWIMRPGRKWPRSHLNWRPFATPLSPTSQRQAIIILNTLFSWLVNAGYLAGNPLSLSRNRQRQAKPRITRYLNDTHWLEVKLAINSMPRETLRDKEHYQRTRWLFTLLYICGLRISEVINNNMGSFLNRRGADGVDRWWMEIVGKGSKIRLIPASKELILELSYYRRFNNMSPMPLPSEKTPLILPVGGSSHRLTRSALHIIIKRVFSIASENLLNKSDNNKYLADVLKMASAHWIRHTSGSKMAENNLSLTYIRDNLGHESLTTTNLYIHSQDELRHQETSEKHKIEW